MHPIIIVSIIAIQLLTMPSQSSSFLVSPLDPRVLSKVYNSSRLNNHQKEEIRIFVEMVKLRTGKDKNKQTDYIKNDKISSKVSMKKIMNFTRLWV